jgi:hypothetical protein
MVAGGGPLVAFGCRAVVAGGVVLAGLGVSDVGVSTAVGGLK